MPNVQSVLNSTRLKRLNNQCPLTLFTAQEQDTPLGVMVTRINDVSTVYNISDERTKAILDMQQFHAKLAEIHRQCADSTSRRRKAAVRSHKKSTGFLPLVLNAGISGSSARESSEVN